MDVNCDIMVVDGDIDHWWRSRWSSYSRAPRSKAWDEYDYIGEEWTLWHGDFESEFRGKYLYMAPAIDFHIGRRRKPKMDIPKKRDERK